MSAQSENGSKRSDASAAKSTQANVGVLSSTGSYILSSNEIPIRLIATQPIVSQGSSTYETELALQFNYGTSTQQTIPMGLVQGLIPGGPGISLKGSKSIASPSNPEVHVGNTVYDVYVHLNQDAATLRIAPDVVNNLPTLSVQWVIGLLDIDVK